MMRRAGLSKKGQKLNLDHLSLPPLPASIDVAAVEAIVVEPIVEAVVVEPIVETVVVTSIQRIPN